MDKMNINLSKLYLYGIIFFIVCSRFINAVEDAKEMPREDSPLILRNTGRSASSVTGGAGDSSPAPLGRLLYGAPPSTPPQAHRLELGEQLPDTSDQGSPQISSIQNHEEPEDHPSALESSDSSLPRVSAPLANQSMFFNDGPNVNQVWTPVRYRIRENRIGIYWDNQSLFMSELDARLFIQSRSKAVLGAGIFGALIGFVPSTPTTGVIMWSIGNTLGIPPSAWQSDLMVAWIMVSTTPVFVRQFYTRGQDIASFIMGRKQFVPAKEDDSLPHINKRSKFHLAVNGMTAIAALIDASFYTGVMFLAESNFRNVAWGTGWAYLMVFFERYCAIGIQNVDRLFTKYAYDSGYGRQKREILLDQLRKTRIEMSRNTRFVKRVYDFMHSEKNRIASGVNASQRYFLTSALFLRPYTAFSVSEDEESLISPRTPATGEPRDSFVDEVSGLREEVNILRARNAESESQVGRAMNAVTLIDRKELSPKQEFMDHLTTLLIGASWFPRVLARQYILEQVCTTLLSMDPTTAMVLAYTCAIFEVLYRNIVENDLQEVYMRSFLDIFSWDTLIDFKMLRKFVGATSFVDGGFFALANFVAAMQKFSEMSVPSPLQISFLIPAFILDQGFFCNLYKEQTVAAITSAATLREGAHISLHEKRAWCTHWLEECEKFIKRADPESLGKLFDITQKAL
ncbi:MAG: hypothetical protein FJX71_05670 [Alphaproteobacteria bacterium]|nr:hypothetical protein [Alphaproteobacteria bacterium]